ncbi:hypothetical protein DAEQUDRAFT_768250 [Daedalea quercina L-15889]|uniref:DUF6534 domain-containing protein n=1 Tax=Daedalea quercina L-15889 TaxID=1314783 RepID=A0A165MWS8_9APHY|nr:hypothetical protein DAEQUDRAFT_768250 [Daedalea quercina L-15889]
MSNASAAATIAEEAALVRQDYALIFVATFISQLLFGIVIAQVYIYYTRYQRDDLWVKTFVFFLFICDVCSAAFTICWMFFLFVSNWGDIVVFSQPTWMLATGDDSVFLRHINFCSLPVVPLVVDPLILPPKGLMTCTTHFFYAWRIRIITESFWLAGLICFFGIGTLAGALGGTAEFLRVKSLTDLMSLKPIAIVWLLCSATGDIMITVILSWSLREKRSTFKRTNKIIDRVIRITIQNGLLTATMATIALILYLTSSIPYHLALSLILPRMYSNSVLSSLNYRDALRDDNPTCHSSSGSLDGFATDSTMRTQQTKVMAHVDAHEPTDTSVIESDGDWEVSSKMYPV